MRVASVSLLLVTVGVISQAHADETAPPPTNAESTAPAPADTTAALPVPTDDGRGRKATIHLEQGHALFAAGHFGAAIEQFQLSNALAPRDDLLFYLAEAYRASNDKPSAFRAYRAYLAVATTGAFADTARIRLVEVSQRPKPRARVWKRIIDRPLTLEQGRIGAIFNIAREGGFYRPAGTEGSWEFATRVLAGGGYGISNDLTVGGAWDGGTKLVSIRNPTTGVRHLGKVADSGQATLYATYLLARGTSYSVAASVLLAEDVEDNRQDVGVGLSARYRFSRRLAVFTGSSPIAPTYSSKLNWEFNDGGHLLASISAGLECQWTPRFYTWLTGNAYYGFFDRPRHSVSTSLLTYITFSEHVDVGAYLNTYSFGLDVRLFL